MDSKEGKSIHKKKGASDKERLKLEKAQKEAMENLAGWKRAQADYQNLVKENEKRMANLKEMIVMQYVEDLIPIYNHFREAVKHIPEDQKKVAWVQGIELILKQMTGFFSEQGVMEIDVLGKPFDPVLADAVDREESSDTEPNIVVKILIPGYKMNNKVIIPAKVVVSV